MYQTNAGIFADDNEAYLIDPCVFPDEIDRMKALAVADGLNLRGIVLTHSHWDHVLGPERVANVPVIASSRFKGTAKEHLAHLRDELNAWETESGLARDGVFVPPVVDVEVYDGDTLPYGNRELRAYQAPGHWEDQIVLHEAEAGVLWAADMLSDVEIPIVDDAVAYLRTIERLTTLDVRLLIPGHGTPTDDAAEIHRRFSIDRAYLSTLIDTVSRYAADGCTIEESVELERRFLPPSGRLNGHDHLANVRSAYMTLTNILKAEKRS